MRCILFDLDGVFYVGDDVIPGARETLNWIKAQGIPHLFLTNTTSKPRSALVAKLARLGLPITEDQLLTPAVATRSWLARHGRGRVALFVPPATREEFSGLTLVTQPRAEAVDAVVIGDLGEDWDFARLNQAFRLLMQQPNPVLIALGMTRYWMAPDGLRLDVAPFIMALQHATGLTPLVLGKPARAFFETALEMLACPVDQAVMIGDDIRGDVKGAQDAGLAALLVRTGKFRPADLFGEVRPDAVISSIAELPHWWARQQIT